MQNMQNMQNMKNMKNMQHMQNVQNMQNMQNMFVVPLAMVINIKLRVAISPVFDFAGDPLDGCVAGQCTQDTASDNSS